MIGCLYASLWPLDGPSNKGAIAHTDCDASIFKCAQENTLHRSTRTNHYCSKHAKPSTEYY